MKWTLCAVGFAALCLTGATSPHAATLKCAADSVKVGDVCVDRYEASVWSIAPSNTGLVKKVQQGKATLADLTGGGASQLAPADTCVDANIDYGTNFPRTGNWTPVLGSSPPSPGVYAVSVPGVKPSACISWFQANQACLLSGKRLLTNREWQGAAAGTPDGAPCLANGGGPSNTGTTGCVSSWGVFDMVGNVAEWVADWADLNDGTCTNWTSGDFSCYGGNGSSQLPGALLRGGSSFNTTDAGVFAVSSHTDPYSFDKTFGFRCAR